MRSLRTLFPAAVFITSAAIAQSPAANITKGDQAYQKLDAPSALKYYEAAIAADGKNTQALWKAAAMSVVLGEFNGPERTTMYQKGEQYARRALATDSMNPDAHFALAQALGRIALTLTTTERVKYALGIHEHATKCLALQPKHAQCLHVLGEWHAQVMRLDQFSRRMAISFLGAKVLETATWKDAIDNMSGAVKLEPKRTIHNLDLGRIYADMGELDKAKASLTAAVSAPAMDYNDKYYKEQAQEALKKL